MKTRYVIALVAILGLYVGSYSVLSCQGKYVPAAWGLGWVKWYIWAPRGFVSGREGLTQHRLPQTLYFPLWFADTRLIHTNDKARSGNYPVNTVLDDALQKWLKQRTEQNQASQAIGAKAPQPER